MTNDVAGGYVRYRSGACGTAELVINEPSYGPGGRDAHIGYAIVDSPFGHILVAVTAHGVAFIALHYDDAYLVSELRAAFPAAHTIAPCHNAAREHATHLVDYAAGVAPELRLALDIRATRFQAAVWNQLCAIPPGETRSYGEIARALGRPTAARAVGHANGSNPVALAIPCHRVIGAGGALTGYRWGLECKRRLLEYERELACKLRLSLFPATHITR